MPQPQADRPYIKTWLRRVGRQLRGSGRLSQVAMALSHSQGGKLEEWTRRLREIIEEATLPDPELITEIDRLLAPRVKSASGAVLEQTRLF